MMSVHSPHSAIPMQTKVNDQPAFILHSRGWQNSSLILDLLTANFGCIRALAKGGRNSRSRGLFQPFNRVSVSWSGRNELKTLTAIDGAAKEIPELLYLPLLYINELVQAFHGAIDSSFEIFTLYDDLLNQINTQNIESCLREFERNAMRIFGYLPDMYSDSANNKPINPVGCYQFLASRGLVHCQCDEDNAIKGEIIQLWNEKNYDNPEVGQTAKAIMRCIIDFNLQGKRLKSRDIYLQMRKWV